MPKNYFICGLDIGSSNIKILVTKQSEKGDLEIVAQFWEAAFGVRRGVVVDVEKVSQIIQNLIQKTESSIGKKIKSVYLNVGGSHLFCTSSYGTVAVSRADQKISQEDVQRVIQAAQTFSLPSNKEILEVFPKEFAVDEERGIKEVLGMQGVRLEVEILALCGFSPYLKNSTQAVLNSDVQIEDILPNPLCSAKSVLTEKEKELGVALLDIGAGTTDLAVFEEGSLIHAAVFPIGSGHITNDLAICLKTDIDTAEKIKLEFGSCFSREKSKKGQIIKIESGDNQEKESLVFSKKLLRQVIEARISEIFDLVNKELKKISRAGLLPAGVVLTGGGAKLPKIVDFAKKEFKLPCRLGKPQGFSPPIEDLSFSTVCGLVLEGNDFQKEKTTFPKGIKEKFKKIFKIFLP